MAKISGQRGGWRVYSDTTEITCRISIQFNKEQDLGMDLAGLIQAKLTFTWNFGSQKKFSLAKTLEFCFWKMCVSLKNGLRKVLGFFSLQQALSFIPSLTRCYNSACLNSPGRVSVQKEYKIRPSFCSKQNPKELKLGVSPVAAINWKYCNRKRAIKHAGIALCIFKVFGLAVQSLLRQSRVNL